MKVRKVSRPILHVDTYLIAHIVQAVNHNAEVLESTLNKIEELEKRLAKEDTTRKPIEIDEVKPSEGMTNKEAAERLKTIKKYLGGIVEIPPKESTAFDIGIKALKQRPCCNCIEFKRYAKEIGFEIEQEPCEDAISRQAVLAIAGDSCLDLNDYEDAKEFCDEINELPPVTPARKKGKWIEERDGYGNITGWHCSNCYDKTGFATTCTWDYCPSCGAEMESEEE